VDCFGVNEPHLQIGANAQTIVGMEGLWEILVTSTNELVTQEAMRTFVALYHNVDQIHAKAKAVGFRKEFVGFWASRYLLFYQNVEKRERAKKKSSFCSRDPSHFFFPG
jgi:hypothetical protein